MTGYCPFPHFLPLHVSLTGCFCVPMNRQLGIEVRIWEVTSIWLVPSTNRSFSKFQWWCVTESWGEPIFSMPRQGARWSWHLGYHLATRGWARSSWGLRTETVKTVDQQVLHPSTLVVGKDLKVVLESQFAMLKNYVYILKNVRSWVPVHVAEKKSCLSYLLKRLLRFLFPRRMLMNLHWSFHILFLKPFVFMQEFQFQLPELDNCRVCLPPVLMLN